MTKTALLSNWTCLLGAALGLSITACDPDVEDLGDLDEVDALEVADEDAELRMVEFEVIAELVTDDGATLVFTREPVSEGSEAYSVGTKMVGPVGGIDYGKAIMQQDLTPLEIFLAFAPEGAEVPEELRVVHQATVVAQDRETDEVRELLLPRAISTSAGHLYCDSYANFTAGVADTWEYAFPRDQSTGFSGGNHSVSRSGWHAAYGMACNSAYGTSDYKLISMCRRQPSDLFWACDSTTLDDGEYGWKIWSGVGGGGGYTSFNFQLNGMMVNNQSATSYLGLVVQGYIL